MATTAEQEMEQRWADFLGEVCFRMTPYTFDTWLRGSRPLACGDGVLVVGVTHGAAAEHIETFLLPLLPDALQRHFPGLAVHIRPLHPADNGNGDGAGPGRDAAAPQPEPEPVPAAPPARNAARARPPAPASAQAGQAASEPAGDDEAGSLPDPALAHFDVSLAGWSKLANYATDFWAELLGSVAFFTWQAIRREDTRRAKTAWTPAMNFSVTRLALLAAHGNRQAISGVWRTCRAASMVQHGAPCPQCRARGGEIQGPHTCRYWRPGSLDRLQAEGVALIERRGEGRQTTYRIRVLNVPPLLTPSQVAELDPLSQQLHSRWLQQQGIDGASWERLTVRHLAPPLEPGL